MKGCGGTTMTVTVLIADDHRIFLDGLRFLLETKGDIKVVGEAINGRQVIQKTKDLEPDIVIMDISMPELNGIEAARQICKLYPATRIIILSMYSTKEYILQAIKAGALSYLLKESTGAELIDAIHVVMSGHRYMSPKISDILIDIYESPGDGSSEARLECLSPREREILQLVVEGKSSSEIANIFFLSPKTVETYRCRLMQKLGINNLVDLIKYAIQKGLTTFE